MFQTEPTWEIREGIEMLRALAGQPELRQFRMLEIALNVPVYRVDVVLPEKYSKDQVLRRFRMTTLSAALEFIRAENPVEVRLTQESAFEDGKEDELRQIFRISEGYNGQGQLVYVCETNHGMITVRKNECPYDGPVSNVRQIWPLGSTHLFIPPRIV